MDGRVLAVPLGSRIDAEVGTVGEEAAVVPSQPVGNGAIVVLPQDIIQRVAVEVPNFNDVPIGRNIVIHMRDVAGEIAGRRPSKPFIYHAAVVAQQYVRKAIAVEVPGAGDVPLRSRIYAEGSAVGEEASVGLPKPVGNGAVVVPPQDVVAPVAVEIASTDDLPIQGNVIIHMRDVAGEIAGSRPSKPFVYHAAVVAQQHVGKAIAVEVPGAGDVPLRSRIYAEGSAVGEEASVGLPKPVGNGAVVVPPQDVVAPVAIEIASTNDLPIQGTL